MPSRQATLAANGGTAVMEFNGDEGARFGIDHLTVGGDYEGLLARATTDGGDRRLFAPVHLSALRDLFLRKRLKGLLKVPRANKLKLHLENPTAQERSVIVQVGGYSGTAAIERQEECLRAEHAPDADEAPRPKLNVARAAVAAAAEGQRIEVPARPYTIAFKRFFVGSDVSLDDLRVALKLFGGDTVLSEVYASQLQDFFRGLEATRPWLVEQSTPLRLTVTNDSGGEADVSVLFESYRQ
jgi:hypothetical protein